MIALRVDETLYALRAHGSSWKRHLCLPTQLMKLFVAISQNDGIRRQDLFFHGFAWVPSDSRDSKTKLTPKRYRLRSKTRPPTQVRTGASNSARASAALSSWCTSLERNDTHGAWSEARFFRSSNSQEVRQPNFTSTARPSTREKSEKKLNLRQTILKLCMVMARVIPEPISRQQPSASISPCRTSMSWVTIDLGTHGLQYVPSFSSTDAQRVEVIPFEVRAKTRVAATNVILYKNSGRPRSFMKVQFQGPKLDAHTAESSTV